MTDVTFVFTNPRHHLEMMSPVADELARRGVDVGLVSLAELRGHDTPRTDARIRRALPINLRRRTGEPATAGTASGPRPSSFGALAKRVAWSVLRPRLRQLIRTSRVVIVPNDAVFPYIELVAQAHRWGARTVLMQEGIRFPLPTAYAGPTYGGAVNAAVCAWGEGSKTYFVASKIRTSLVAVTGAPRLDELDPGTWAVRGAELLAHHGLSSAPLAFLSNPIEIQGYGTKELKLELFRRFLEEAAPQLRARGCSVIVKNHLHEDPHDYERVAAASSVAGLVTVVGHATPIFAVLAVARAAVVLTSTVGLEALTFGVPLAVLEIPGHDFAFDYVQRDAAIALRGGQIAAGVAELLEASPARRDASQAFVAHHLHDRGRARFHVADVIERVLAAR
ncbi:MAG: hypothetical protein M3680_00355 [Myxococcota bacterium]|nr:hypothetical protein [Myxococcota bacterium]